MTWRGFGLHRHPWYAKEGREQTEAEKKAMAEAKVTVFVDRTLPQPPDPEHDG